MNICMFTNTYLPHVGGVARSVAFFTEDLRRLGHKVLVVAPEFENGHEDVEGELLRVPAIQNFNGSDFSLHIPIPFLINEEIQKFKPDIIHSHHPYLLGDSALRVARRRNLPLVFTHHTMYEEYIHYVPMNSPTMARFVIKLSTEYANLCHRVIAPSASVARILAKRGVTVPIEEIPTGVDVQFFAGGDGSRARRKFGLSEDEPVIGHLGRLAPEKNLEYLGDAVAAALKELPGARFLVFGKGPSEEVLKAIFAREGMSDRLISGGVVGGRDLADAYRAMDLFVFASKSETQGMVLTEAMAAGTPVAALDAPGAREVVREGVNGRLLSGDASMEDYARAVVELMLDRGMRRRFAEAAGATAEAFSREVSAGKLERLYLALQESSPERDPLERDDLPSWTALLGRLRAEWELLGEKTSAAYQTLSEEEEEAEME